MVLFCCKVAAPSILTISVLPGCQGSGQAKLHVGTKGSSASGRLQETPQYLPGTATFQSVSRPKYKHAEDRLPAGIELARHFRFREQLSSKEGATTTVIPLNVPINILAHLLIWCSACARSSFFFFSEELNLHKNQRNSHLCSKEVVLY